MAAILSLGEERERSPHVELQVYDGFFSSSDRELMVPRLLMGGKISPPTGPGWVHEIKHDGYRLEVHVRHGRVRLFTARDVYFHR